MYCFPHVLGKVSALTLCYDGINHPGIIKWKHQFFFTCSCRSSQVWNPADHHWKIFSSFCSKGRGKRFAFDRKLLTRTLNMPASWGLSCAERWLLLLQLLLWRTPETNFLEATQEHKILFIRIPVPCCDQSIQMTLWVNPWQKRPVWWWEFIGPMDKNMEKLRHWACRSTDLRLL